MKLEDAVPAVKSWFYRQCGWSLLVLDSADSIDNADDLLYIDLEYFLPDASLVDVVVTTRSSRAREMSALEAVEVAEMAPIQIRAVGHVLLAEVRDWLGFVHHR